MVVLLWTCMSVACVVARVCLHVVSEATAIAKIYFCVVWSERAFLLARGAWCGGSCAGPRCGVDGASFGEDVAGDASLTLYISNT